MVSKGAFGDGLCGSVKADGEKWTVLNHAFRGECLPFTYASSMTWRKNSWALGEIWTEAELGRSPEKKSGCGATVSLKEPLNEAPGMIPGGSRPEIQGRKVALCFFPGRHLLPGPDLTKVVKSHKDPVSPTKPL